jgi:hypothetical protein
MIQSQIRFPKLLAAARDAPCMRCSSTGTTVAAHANRVDLGKGTGIKAPDFYVAYLCYQCHDEYDGRAGRLTRGERNELWTQAYLKTVGYWFRMGIVDIAWPNPL